MQLEANERYRQPSVLSMVTFIHTDVSDDAVIDPR